MNDYLNIDILVALMLVLSCCHAIWHHPIRKAFAVTANKVVVE
jgi:hypothetical protein